MLILCSKFWLRISGWNTYTHTHTHLLFCPQLWHDWW